MKEFLEASTIAEHIYDTTSAMTAIEVQNDFHVMSIMIDRLKDMTEVPEERGA